MVNQHLPVAEKVARVEMWYQVGDYPACNVYHVLLNELWTVGRLQECASNFINWERDVAHKVRSNQASLVLIRLTDLTSPDGPMWTEQDPLDTTGTLESPPLPGNATVATQGQTGLRGSGRQARSYWVGLAQESVSGNTLTEDAVNGVIDAMQQLIPYVASGGNMALGVLHRTLEGVELDPATFSPILRWVMRDRTTDSQTSRLPNHKRDRRPT